jgi:hypothetical protein
MKIALIIVALLVVIVAIICIIGASLPREHVASRTVNLKATPQQVYAVLADVANAPSWRKDVKRVEMISPTRFREVGARHAITYDIIEQHAPAKLVTRIADRDLGFGGTWTYDVAPDGDTTRVTITEHGVISNVFFRFMSAYALGYTATMDGVLGALRERFH